MPEGLAWLNGFGVTAGETSALIPCVPGEFTAEGSLYVNTRTPNVVYRGSNEGTLPLVAGRWYLIPTNLTESRGRLKQETRPVAAVARLLKATTA